MPRGVQRWFQEQRSPFAWEQDALDYIDSLMPDTEPYRAWATFKATAASGRVNEMDLLFVGPAGVFLVELKAHPGELVNRGRSWTFRDRQTGFHRTIDNPLHLVDQKSKELRSSLERAARDWAAKHPGKPVPFVPRIEPAVFLSGDRLVSGLEPQQRIKVFGRDDQISTTGLPGIWKGLLNKPMDERRRDEAARISPILPDLMVAIGAAPIKKKLAIGRFRVAGKPLDSGPTWMDFVGVDEAMPDDRRRARIYFTRSQATPEERERTRRAAEREYLILRGLTHRGIAQALDFQQTELGPAVLFAHRDQDLRLDQFLDVHGSALTLETRLDMVRQLAEAMSYAHRRHLFHRTLAARAVYADTRHLDKPILRISDWQAAARTADSTGGTHANAAHMTTLSKAPIEESAHVYLAPEIMRSGDVDPATMDVFGLGTVAYLILSGRPPAESRAQLAAKIAATGGLRLSEVLDAVPTALDDLVYEATRTLQSDRMHDVAAFLTQLDRVDTDLAALGRPEEPDPLEVKAGQPIDGDWKVVKVLGSGSTARALLVERADAKPGASYSARRRVYKVALDESKDDGLEQEAAALQDLHSEHIVKCVDGPFSLGDRAVIALEQAGDGSLAQLLRDRGRCTPDELQRFGRHLFDALEHMAGRQVWHRDIKPDNVGVRVMRNRSKSLVLFDFSHTGAKDTDLTAGTHAYLDPFLGPPRRPKYDEHAEWWAASMTLHEMASAELPTWGDGMVAEPAFTKDVLPSIPADAFDPALREGMVAFFSKALHRAVDERFATLEQMRAAWEDVFRAADATRPASVHQTTDGEGVTTSVEQDRDKAAQAATPSTSLADAGLSPRALEAAGRLNAHTVADLVAVRNRAIWNLRGIGRLQKTELVQRQAQWKPTLTAAAAKPVGRARQPVDDPSQAGTIWNLDDIVADLLTAAEGRTGSKKPDAVRLMLGLPNTAGAFHDLPVWPTQTAVAELLGVEAQAVSIHFNDAILGKATAKTRVVGWIESKKVAWVRDEVVAILAQRGRIAEVSQLLPELEEKFGSEQEDRRLRTALAAAVLRAGVETEAKDPEAEHTDPETGRTMVGPRISLVRHDGRVLLVLESDDESVPAPSELVKYAKALSMRADVLVGAESATSPQTVVSTLRSVPTPENMDPLTDTRLVQLAAAATSTTAATARLELYSVDMPLPRALRLSQAAISANAEGFTLDQLKARILARLPEFRIGEPTLQQMRAALRESDSDLEYGTGMFRRRAPSTSGSATEMSSGAAGSRTLSRGPLVGGAPGSARARAAEFAARLDGTRKRGGFLALNVRLRDLVDAADVLAAQSGVAAVNLSARFIVGLREAAEAAGRPWGQVLRADMQSSERSAWHPGLSSLIDEVWESITKELQAVQGTLFLHEAGVLAHYPHGGRVLTTLQNVAGTQDGPHAVWLLCPMQAPRNRPRLGMDDFLVPVTTENQWAEMTGDAIRGLTRPEDGDTVERAGA